MFNGFLTALWDLLAAEGVEYAARFITKTGFGSYRLPFQKFRPKDSRQPPLVDPSKVVKIGIRCQRPSAEQQAIVQPVAFKMKLYFIKVRALSAASWADMPALQFYVVAGLSKSCLFFLIDSISKA